MSEYSPLQQQGLPSAFARTARTRLWRLLVALGLGLTLGACSKCAVPNWQRSSAATTPTACHGEPSPQY